MLVLSRKMGQGILIPAYEISVQILAIKGATIRLGVSAPTEVKVLRGEVQDSVSRPTLRPPAPG